jgi:hypothetical protein
VCRSEGIPEYRSTRKCEKWENNKKRRVADRLKSGKAKGNRVINYKNLNKKCFEMNIKQKLNCVISLRDVVEASMSKLEIISWRAIDFCAEILIRLSPCLLYWLLAPVSSFMFRNFPHFSTIWACHAASCLVKFLV